MRKVNRLTTRVLILLCCSELCLGHVRSETGHAASEAEQDADYTDDYSLDDLAEPRTSASGCEDGMFQCSDK
jgi:hypothetical protein